jgi:hypothetical protein
MRREEIDDFAFAFVAPLRAEHRQVHIGLRFYPQMIFPPVLGGIAQSESRTPRESRKKYFIFKLTTRVPLLNVCLSLLDTDHVEAPAC